MGHTFADSEFLETAESQLTLGTASLLGIFFGLVMVCGIFFGFGYSIGRRDTAGIASAATSSKPSPIVPSTSHPEARPQLPAASLSPSIEPLVARLDSAPAAPAMKLPGLPDAARATADSEKPDSAASTRMDGVSRPSEAHVSAPLKDHIAKPSAFAPVIVVQAAPGTPLQRIVAGPQFTSQSEPSPYFVWTPPFDVHRPRVHGREAAYVSTIHTRAIRPAFISAVHTTSTRPVLVLQIAALSRQDDAEVLASSLRKGGFTPSIKSGVEDALFHVEVGPFDRETAVAARQRLIARGYNAILR